MSEDKQVPYMQDLFDYISETFSVSATESEMHDLINVCRKYCAATKGTK